MLPDRVSNPGPLTYESGALPCPFERSKSSQSMNEREVSVRYGPLLSVGLPYM